MSTNKSNKELVTLIKEKIAKYSLETTVSYEEGQVISNRDGIVIASGLNSVMLNELVCFENGSYGLVLNLESNSVGIVMLGKYDDILENSIVKRTKKIISIPVGDQLLGRIVNTLGQEQDGKEKIKKDHLIPIEKIPFGVMERKSVDEPLATGILAIDAMFPIGKGQRELIIGDRQTGKTTLAIDIIINQKDKNVKCIYVAIGQRESTILNVHQTLLKHNAMSYTTIVATTSSDLPSLLFLAPYAGITIAEHWLSKGEDVLIVYDDLSKHAAAYRTISLLLRRAPGREAYPGDIFYLHSRLLERAGRLNKENGGGSITALPIVETQIGDISAYIPTNVISITDGQLFLNANMFNVGQCPAIDPSLSVSRVGSAAQKKYIKQVASSLKLDLSQYNDLKVFSQFGSDLDHETKNILDHGTKTLLMLKQDRNSPYSQLEEAVLLFAIKYHFIKWVPYDFLVAYKNDLLKHFKNHLLLKKLSKSLSFDENLITSFTKEFKIFTHKFVHKIPDYKQKNNYDLEELK